MINGPERRTVFEHYIRTRRRTLPGGIEVKFNPYHDPIDGRFTFAPGGPKGRSDARRSDVVDDDDARPSIRRVDLTQEEYSSQAKELWASVEGRSDKGYRSDRDATKAGDKVRRAPALSTADVEAPSDVRGYVTSVADATAKARLSGSQDFEKTLTLSRRADGSVVTASIGVAGSQGGSVQGIDAKTIAVVHVHYSGMIQRPFGGDNSAVKFRDIPSFVIIGRTGEVWEVGRQKGEYVQRIVRGDGTATRWRRFD